MTVLRRQRTAARRPRLAALVAVAILIALGFGAGRAQGQSEAIVTHPAHIHEGTCDDLNPNPVAPLNDIAPRGYDAEEERAAEDAPEPRGSLSAASVEVSESTAEIGFDTILDAAHAINVHESDQNIQTYIACGAIGGQVFDNQLFISLAEQNDSGYFGIAVLEPDGDNTKVTIYLGRATEEGDEQPTETPEATETPETEVGDDEGTPVG